VSRLNLIGQHAQVIIFILSTRATEKKI